MPNLARTNNSAALLGLGAALLLVVGCASVPPPMGQIAGFPSSGTSRIVVGDWNDVRAAAIVAASETEIALTDESTPDGETIILTFDSIRDEPVRLVATTRGRPAGEIELTCRYGDFGDTVQEARVLDAMADRLSDLHGVPYRALR